MGTSRLTRLLAPLLLALAIAGCASSSAKTVTVSAPTASYPRAIQTAFMRSCDVFGGNPTDCGCALRQAEARIPLTLIGRDELELEYGDPTEQLQSTLGRIISHCAGQQALQQMRQQEETG
jgi:hypothetical protein